MRRFFKITVLTLLLIGPSSCLVINMGEIRFGMDSAQINDTNAQNQEQKPPSEDISE